MFKSKEEFAQAMLEGRKFLTPLRLLVFADLEKHPTSPFRLENTCGLSEPLDDAWSLFDKVTEIIEPAPWYENIPEQGVLCWVWSTDDELDKEIRIVVGYNKFSGYPFLLKDGVLTNVTPLTPEEAMNLVYQGEQEEAKLEDKALCWCLDDDWNETWPPNVLFYDAINKCTFRTDGKRDGGEYDHYQPIPRSQWPQHAIDAYEKLED